MFTDGQICARANLVRHGYLVKLADRYERTPAGAYLLATCKGA